jgi:hypothetical protein
VVAVVVRVHLAVVVEVGQAALEQVPVYLLPQVLHTQSQLVQAERVLLQEQMVEILRFHL